MRIGLVLEQFDPARGGREQWTWAYTQRLLELGHEVHIVARSCSAKARQLPIAYHPLLCDPSPVVFAGAVRAVLEPLALDIVHDMGMGWYCDVFHPHGGSMAATRRAEAAVPAGVASPVEADSQLVAAAASHVPRLDGPAIRRSRADRAGPVAGVGGRFCAIPRG